MKQMVHYVSTVTANVSFVVSFIYIIKRWKQYDELFNESKEMSDNDGPLHCLRGLLLIVTARYRSM